MQPQITTPDWRIIPSFPDYEINQYGMVRREYLVRGVTPQICYLPPLTKYAHTNDPKILLKRPDNGQPSKQSQARLLAEAFLGKPPSISHTARFKDGNPKNSTADNVEWVAPKGWTPDDGMEWRIIPIFEDYTVREDGLIRRAAATMNSRQAPIKQDYKPGYTIGPLVNLRKHKTGETVNLPVREAVATAFIGHAPSVFHTLIFKDGNCINLHWKNLEWVLNSGMDVPDNGMKWRKIPGIPDYEIRADGLVRRLTPDAFGNNAGLLIKALTSPKKNREYPYVGLTLPDGRRKTFLVYRLVARAFLKPRPKDKTCIAHNDGDKSNSHYTNLRWATHKENAQDRILHGTNMPGEENPTSVLTEDVVKQILAMRKVIPAYSIQQIADKFNVGTSTVFAVISGRTWRHFTKLRA